jgi:hypothetical protein
LAEHEVAMSATESRKFDFTKLNTLAVVSLATALTSIGAVAAIITGHVALTQIKRSGESGRGLALAGTIIGYLTIALWIVSSIGFFIAGALLKGRYGMDFPMHGWGWGWDR